MENEFSLRVIGRYYCRLEDKFGLPRQSGICKSLGGRIVFSKEYSHKEAFRGIEGYSHLWLLWIFSDADADGCSLTVRPPKLGGNTRMGVFATRSPFRPNRIGLSCVKLEKVETDENDTVSLTVSGGDLMNGTPIIDVKPYIPYADSVPDALSGFSVLPCDTALTLDFPSALEEMIPPEDRVPLKELLSQDARPGYHNDPGKHYHIKYHGFDVGFTVSEKCVHVFELKEVK